MKSELQDSIENNHSLIQRKSGISLGQLVIPLFHKQGQRVLGSKSLTLRKTQYYACLQNLMTGKPQGLQNQISLRQTFKANICQSGTFLNP